MKQDTHVDMSPVSSASKPTALVLDNDTDRKGRAERITALKELGLKIFPARTLEGTLERCIAKSFDLVVVHAGQASELAITLCERLLAAKPQQKVLLLHDASTPEHSYSVSGDLNQLRTRVQRLLAGHLSGTFTVAA